MYSGLPPAGINRSLLGMEWRPSLCSALASRVAVFSLSLSNALGLGRGRNLILRRQDVGGGRTTQGRRHDWIGDKDP